MHLALIKNQSLIVFFIRTDNALSTMVLFLKAGNKSFLGDRKNMVHVIKPKKSNFSSCLSKNTFKTPDKP